MATLGLVDFIAGEFWELPRLDIHELEGAVHLKTKSAHIGPPRNPSSPLYNPELSSFQTCVPESLTNVTKASGAQALSGEKFILHSNQF